MSTIILKLTLVSYHKFETLFNWSWYVHELSSRSIPSVIDLAASYWFLPKITRPNEVNSFRGLQACISKLGLLVAQNYKFTYLQKQILTAAAFEFLKSTGGLKKEFKWNNWRTIWLGKDGWDIPDVSDTPPIPIRGRKRPPYPQYYGA